MVGSYEEKYGDWEGNLPDWVTGWRLVEAVSIRAAACILTGTDPAPYRYGNSILPSDVEAMETALEQAILMGRLRPFAAWAYNPQLSEEVPIAEDEIDPHLNLVSQQTTVRVVDLVEWADARGVPHCWRVANTPSGNASDLADFPDELRAAVEAFKAVHADPRALAGKSPRQALGAWLKANKPGLSEGARDRIATVANWQPTGGAPKTPG